MTKAPHCPVACWPTSKKRCGTKSSFAYSPLLFLCLAFVLGQVFFRSIEVHKNGRSKCNFPSLGEKWLTQNLTTNDSVRSFIVSLLPTDQAQLSGWNNISKDRQRWYFSGFNKFQHLSVGFVPQPQLSYQKSPAVPPLMLSKAPAARCVNIGAKLWVQEIPISQKFMSQIQTKGC